MIESVVSKASFISENLHPSLHHGCPYVQKAEMMLARVVLNVKNASFYPPWMIAWKVTQSSVISAGILYDIHLTILHV